MTAQIEQAAATPPAADGAAKRESPTTLQIRHLSKRFVRQGGAEVRAIDDTTFDAWPGEFIVLLGPSGCGKTTLLRCIAGLERPDAGEIEIQGRRVFASESKQFVGPERRGISMVFQTYALWPHMSAADNIAYPLRYGRQRKIGGNEVRQRVRDVLDLVGIPELYSQYPHQMSGGQQQRVALARALVSGSPLVLFDEPLSNVDAKVREQLRDELRQMQQKIGFTAVYVTHDQEEALQLADRVAVIAHGRIEQLGTPTELYLNPATRGIATFLGKTNQVSGTVLSATADSTVVDTQIGQVVCRAADGLERGQRVVAAWRPERSTIAAGLTGATNCWEATVVQSRFSGPYTETLLDVAGVSLRHWATGSSGLSQSIVSLTVDPAEVRVFPDDAD